MADLVRIEQLRVGDRVRSTPGGTGPIDLVLRLHLRRDAATLTPTAVTVTHESGCWTRLLGELVERVEPRVLSNSLV